MKQETYVSYNMFHETYCVAWGNVAQLRTLLLCFSSIQMERIQQIAWNMFPIVMFFIDSNGKNTTNCLKYISLMCTELQICCMRYIYETCFMQCFIGEGAAHTSETNCLKHVAWNRKYLYDATNQYISMEQRTLWNKKLMFLKYISCNLLIVLREEMLRNFRHCHVFHWFKCKDYNKLSEIYFLSGHWTENMLHAICLWNVFHAICFISVCHTLYYTHYIKCFANWVYCSVPAWIRTRFPGLVSQFFIH